MLLDIAFAHPSFFPTLNRKANLKHIRHDYNLSRQADDETIYILATQEKRIVITQDDGFRKQVKTKGTGVFIIPSYLTNEETDRLLSSFISGKNPEDFLGKAIKI